MPPPDVHPCTLLDRHVANTHSMLCASILHALPDVGATECAVRSLRAGAAKCLLKGKRVVLRRRSTAPLPRCANFRNDSERKGGKRRRSSSERGVHTESNQRPCSSKPSLIFRHQPWFRLSGFRRAPPLLSNLQC